ncbi:MAG: hypothetical protein V1798_10835 [Pseudomonadota bacterium]
MAAHVRRLSLIGKLLPLFALVLVAACSSDGSGPGISSVAWTGTANGSSAEFLVTSQSAQIESDGDVSLLFGGQETGEEFTMRLDVGGGRAATIPPDQPSTVQIGSSSVNLNLYLGTSHYRGTSGSVTFTKFETLPGGSLSGNLDVGLVPLQGSGSVTMNGDFTAPVVTPTPTATP